MAASLSHVSFPALVLCNQNQVEIAFLKLIMIMKVLCNQKNVNIPKLLLKDKNCFVGSEIFCWRTWPKCFWSRNCPWLLCLRKRSLPAWGGRLCWRYVHGKQTNLPLQQISLVHKIQENLDPQSFLTLPSWPQCWRTSWRMFLTLSTPKMALRCNLTMVCR